MNQSEIHESAATLERLLHSYALSDVIAKTLLEDLAELLRDAVNAQIAKPVDWRAVPGSMFFSECGLRQYQDLDAAYARFKIAVTGGPSPTLQALRNFPRVIQPNLSSPAP